MLSTSSLGTLPHLALLVCLAQYMPSLWLMLSTFHLVPYHNQSQSDCLAHLYQGFDSCRLTHCELFCVDLTITHWTHLYLCWLEDFAWRHLLPLSLLPLLGSAFPTGFKVDILNATPRMIHQYQRSPHRHPAGMTFHDCKEWLSMLHWYSISA